MCTVACASRCFRKCQCRRAVQVAYTVRVQLLEIYNEQLRDLLAPAQPGAARRLDIRNTAASGLNVPDALQVGSTAYTSRVLRT